MHADLIDRAKLKIAISDLIPAVAKQWGTGSTEHNLVRDIADVIDRVPSAPAALAHPVEAVVAECANSIKAHERLLRSVLAAIDTGRSEPLFIVRDQLRNFLADKAPNTIQGRGTMDNIDFAQAQLTIERIAKLAEQFAQQAGIGGMETAGHIVSYLAEHPRDIEPCLRFGVFELPEGWHERGRLTWHAKNGKVTRPEHARHARIIKSLSQAPR